METSGINPGAYGDIPAAIAGQFFDEQPRQVDARVNGDTASFPFGVAVVHQAGDGDTLVRLPTSSNFAGVIEGITGFSGKVSTLGWPYYTAPDGTLASGNGPLVPNMSLDVLRKGRIWVNVENAVAKGGAVYTRVAANGGNTQLGAFRADADSGNAVLVKGAVYDTTAAAGGLAALRFDFDAQNAVEEAETADVITKDFSLPLASIPTSGTAFTLAAFTPGIAGEILELAAEINVAGQGAGASVPLQLGIGNKGGPYTATMGGGFTLALTDATAGNEKTSAVTAGGQFTASQQIGITVSSVATAFTGGQVTLTVTYRPYP